MESDFVVGFFGLHQISDDPTDIAIRAFIAPGLDKKFRVRCEADNSSVD
jgi:hypothetical protein